MLQNPYIINGKQCPPSIDKPPLCGLPPSQFYKKILMPPSVNCQSLFFLSLIFFFFFFFFSYQSSFFFFDKIPLFQQYFFQHILITHSQKWLIKALTVKLKFCNRKLKDQYLRWIYVVTRVQNFQPITNT